MPPGLLSIPTSSGSDVSRELDESDIEFTVLLTRQNAVSVLLEPLSLKQSSVRKLPSQS